MTIHIVHPAAEPHADPLDRVPVAVAWLVALLIDVAGWAVMVFLASWLATVLLAAGVVMMRVMGG